jgi:hypothetical protein
MRKINAYSEFLPPKSNDETGCSVPANDRPTLPLPHSKLVDNGEKPVHQLFAADYPLHSIFVALKMGTKPMLSTVPGENGALNPTRPDLCGKVSLEKSITRYVRTTF